MTTGKIVTDLHRIWLKENRARIAAGSDAHAVILSLAANRIEQAGSGRMNMAATIDAVIKDLEHDEAMLGA